MANRPTAWVAPWVTNQRELLVGNWWGDSEFPLPTGPWSHFKLLQRHNICTLWCGQWQMKQCDPSESNWALYLKASRSQSEGNVLRPCPRLSKGYIACRIICTRKFALGGMKVKISWLWTKKSMQGIIHEGLWKRTHPSHCFNLDFSSHEVWWWGCAWRIIIFALPFKENRKLRKVRNFTEWLFQYELNKFSYLFLEKNKS